MPSQSVLSITCHRELAKGHQPLEANLDFAPRRQRSCIPWMLFIVAAHRALSCP
jgi:hypothetical protein